MILDLGLYACYNEGFNKSHILKWYLKFYTGKRNDF